MLVRRGHYVKGLFGGVDSACLEVIRFPGSAALVAGLTRRVAGLRPGDRGAARLPAREPGGQAAAEARARAVPTPDSARSLLRTLTEEPHVAGTPADHETALFVRDKLREWGWRRSRRV